MHVLNKVVLLSVSMRVYLEVVLATAVSDDASPFDYGGRVACSFLTPQNHQPTSSLFGLWISADRKTHRILGLWRYMSPADLISLSYCDIVSLWWWYPFLDFDRRLFLCKNEVRRF